MHFTQQSLMLFAGVLALLAIGLGIYSANRPKGK